MSDFPEALMALVGPKVMEVLMSQTEESMNTPMAEVKTGQTWYWDGFLDVEGRTVVTVFTGDGGLSWDVLEENGSPNNVNFREGLRAFWTLVEDA